jgi:hypothetical protein
MPVAVSLSNAPPTAAPSSVMSPQTRRYLGADEPRWDERFRRYLHDDPAGKGTTWLRLHPALLTARDLSYAV